MVGHTGNFQATVEAVETVDRCLGDLTKAILGVNGIMLVTADHGNAEGLVNLQTGDIIKEHSNNPVPFIVIAKDFEGQSEVKSPTDLATVTPSGVLSDIAPTILKLLNLEKPKEMRGRTLF